MFACLPYLFVVCCSCCVCVLCGLCVFDCFHVFFPFTFVHVELRMACATARRGTATREEHVSQS